MTTKHCCEFSAAFQGLTDKLADQSKLVRLNQEHVAKADARITALTDALRAAREEITRMRNWIRPGDEPTFSWGHKSFLINVATETLARIDAILPRRGSGGETVKKYYLQDSRQYVGNDMLFWCKGRSGYTTNLDEAHEFSLEEALAERPTDIPWEVEQMRALSRPAVDMQKLPCTMMEQYKKLLRLAGALASQSDKEKP